MTQDAEIDALVADRYLEALLAAVGRHAEDAPADATLDPELREAARVLRRSLVRVHPSFRFEERLAGRLSGLASAQAAPALAATGGGALIDFPGAIAPLESDPLLDAILRGDLDPADSDAVARASRTPVTRRPLIVGGAITSAAISLVGVAYVAWRASRPDGGSNRPMARAARAARARRTAAALSAIAATSASTALSALSAGPGSPGGPA